MNASILLWSLSLEEVLRDIPHDARSLVVYGMLAVFAAFVWHGSRPRRPGPPPG
jgi:hypothetical protein